MKRITGTLSFDLAINERVTVVGSGSSAADGTYIERGVFNGKPYYNLEGEPDSTENNVVVWLANQWKIQAAGASPLYRSTSDVAFPWLVTNWLLDEDGSNPVPTVTQG